MRRLHPHQYVHIAAGRLFRAYDKLNPNAFEDASEDLDSALMWIDEAAQHLSSLRQSIKARIRNRDGNKDK